MYKRYYDGYARTKPDSGEIIIPETVVQKSVSATPGIPAEKAPETELAARSGKGGGLNLPWDTDDLILIGILLFLLFDKKDCSENDDNNMFLLLIVGFVLLSDIL